MKLSEARVDTLTDQIVAMLEARTDLQLSANSSRLRVLVRQAMVDELLVEDLLEEEIRRLLVQYEKEMRRGGVSYSTLFNRIKAKLVRERGLVL